MAVFDVIRVAILMLLIGSSASQSASDIANIRLQKLFDTSYSKDRLPVSSDGKPIPVLLGLHLREMMLKETDFIMSLDSVDVIQSWTDPRLSAVTHETRDLDLNKSQVDKVWKPDVHVVNGRHQILADHKTFTVSKSGHVTFQQRLSVDILCPNFTSHMKPLICSVQFQPYSFTQSELVYQWDSVTFDPQLVIPKYSLVALETAMCPMTTHSGSRRYSCQQLSLSFRTHVNFFATEIYGASVLLVALSWTGFWVSSDNPLHRLCLGLIIVLILVVYSVGFRLLHNKVGVPGNVEVWVAFCTLFVLASLIEYVFVHVLLSTVPSQLKRICCKRRMSASLSAHPACCRNEFIASDRQAYEDSQLNNSSYKKAARVIDVTCGLLFPVIFILFNVAYWITY